MGCFFALFLAIWLSTALSVNALPYPFNVARDGFTPLAVSPTTLMRHLGPQLSSNTTIFGKNDTRFANATSRWNAYAEPSFVLVVEPGTEADVATTVKYANAFGLPFLAVNRGHGSTETLNRLKNGIEIHARVLDKITISADGQSALMQGGVYTDSLIQTLWDVGKVSASGSCGCVGIMGAGLGGGHGRYEGFYGMVTDNLLSMNVVLANSEAVTVSENSYPDLWWGMRGAGHNFGIVTSFNIKIYDRTVETWFYVTYLFTQDRLESVFEAANQMMGNGTQRKELMNYFVYAWVPTVSTTEPVIVFTIYYVGTAAQAAPYIAPFDRLGPLSRTTNSIPYPEIPGATGTGSASPLCQFGFSRIQFPVGLLTYNVTTNRQIYNLFKQKTLDIPSFNGSLVVFEGYSLEGMKAVNPDSTAYPHREDNILVAIQVVYTPNSSLDSSAISWGKETAQLFHAGDEPGRKINTYVNYAFGDEPLEQMYGYEPWRLERLRGLKATYDPKGRFNYYNSFV